MSTVKTPSGWVWVVKDDYDQKTVCIVEGVETGDEATKEAKRAYGEIVEGDLYAYLSPLIVKEQK